MLQNQRACQLVRSQTGCEPLALTVAWGARTAGRCARGVLGAVKHQRFSDRQLETFAARAPGICPKPVCRCRGALPAAAAGRCGGCVGDRAGAQRGALFARLSGQHPAPEHHSPPAGAGGGGRLHRRQRGHSGRVRPAGRGHRAAPGAGRQRGPRPQHRSGPAVGRWVLFVDCDDCLLRTQWRRCWRRRRVPGRISCRAAGSIATKPTPAVRCSSTQKRAAPGPRRLDVVELPGTPWGKLYRPDPV